MQGRLAGRTAVVTGASSGIGRALALALTARGMRVVAAARSLDQLNDLAREAGSALHPIAADVTQADSVRRLVDAARERCGGIDAVVNNAGIGYVEPFLASDAVHWRDTIETNLVGALSVTRAFLPLLVAAGRGIVVNVGSAAVSGWPYLALYAASKAALAAASLAIDRELAGTGVRVLSVEIGSTSGTGFGSRSDGENIAAATRAWTESGIPWVEGVVTAEASAQKIIDAIEAAL